MKYRIRQYRSGHYQVYFSHEGKQVFLQKMEDGMPLDSEAMARVLILHLKRDGYDPRRFNKDKEFHFDVAVKTWIDLSTCSDEWLSERKRIADNFLIPFFGKKDIREIQTIHVNQFEKSLRDKALGLSYIKNIRNELRSFLRFNKDSIPKMPEFRPIPIQLPMIRWLTLEQQDEVLQKIPKRHSPIFTFLKTYPVRPNEACGLKWDNVFQDAEDPYFVVSSVMTRNGVFKTFTKTKRVRPYPILPEISWIFNRNGSDFVFTKRGEPYTSKILYDIWRQARKKVDVPVVSLYQATKHSFGWNRIEQGYSMEDVSLLMGHTSTKMTRRYAGQTLKRMAEILRGVHKPLCNNESPKLLELKENVKTDPCHPHGE
jgi:integrase